MVTAHDIADELIKLGFKLAPYVGGWLKRAVERWEDRRYWKQECIHHTLSATLLEMKIDPKTRELTATWDEGDDKIVPLSQTEVIEGLKKQGYKEYQAGTLKKILPVWYVERKRPFSTRKPRRIAS
jgi:hypothetical protein